MEKILPKVKDLFEEGFNQTGVSLDFVRSHYIVVGNTLANIYHDLGMHELSDYPFGFTEVLDICKIDRLLETHEISEAEHDTLIELYGMRLCLEIQLDNAETNDDYYKIDSEIIKIGNALAGYNVLIPANDLRDLLDITPAEKFTKPTPEELWSIKEDFKKRK